MGYRPLVVTVSLVVTGSVVAQESAPEVTAVCALCHGESAPSQHADVPTLHGLPEIVIENALYDFRGGTRPCRKPACGETGKCPDTTMCVFAEPMKHEDMEVLAQWYAAQPFVPADQPYDPARAARGEALHMERCEICHTQGGTDPVDEASILRGQHMDYLRQALEDYRASRRTAVAAMDRKVQELTEDEIETLVHYYASPVEGGG